MINIKGQVYQAISQLTDNVCYGYPKEFDSMPLITYRQSVNTSKILDKNDYEVSYIGFSFDVWNKADTEEGVDSMVNELDDIMTKQFGFTRTSYFEDLSFPDYLHTEVSYEGKVDSNGIIYNIN